MDFGQLLHVAKKNNEEVKYGSRGKYYSTKFSAPKKETKEKKLSDNIKRFLEKKEQEEREKAKHEREKVQSLLAMRDEKSKNKIRKMLKVTKSANKSVLDDAKNLNHTAVTMEGPIQPDEDDYGYVSHEAAAFFQKYVEKVGKLSDDKVPGSRPKTKNDICGTKDRVKAAILKEHEDKATGRSRSSGSASITSGSTKAVSAYPTSSRHKDLYDPGAERDAEERRRRDEQHKQRAKKPPAPPPMDFQQLLKLAEKKQFEPVGAVKVETKKEPERLLTKKEKDELEQRKLLQEEKEKKKNGHPTEKPKMEPNGRIPKLNSTARDTFKKPLETSQKLTQMNSPVTPVKGSSLNTSNIKTSSTQNALLKKSTSNIGTKINSTSTTSKHNSSSSREVASKPSTYSEASREFAPKHTAKMSPKDVRKPITPVSKMNYKDIKPREFPPKDVPSRKFPPEDTIRPKLNSNMKPNKRRIFDEDDEDEYDSEMDDFIDDDDMDPNQVSNYIKQIFGYDKRKYRQIDDEDDAGMESSFAQQMREETISKKIGLMEDLEDMRQEQAEKQRKLGSLKKKKYK